MKATAGTNPAQQRAVEHSDGPLLIIAGPGSGKTHTLVERIVHLVLDKGVAPEAVLVATFTEKAAAELITRVSNRLAAVGAEVNLAEMYIGTLHSICLRILDEHRERTRLKRSYALWDQFDQQYALYRSLKEFNDVEGAAHLIGAAGQGASWTKAETLAKRFNQVSEELLDVDRLLAAGAPEVRALGALYRRYLAFLEEHNALDFSMIQVEALALLRRHPEVLARLQEKLRYLMVDEYQDTNTVQEALLLTLAGGRANICVVGDDDQSLYRFRGATVRNILEFPSRFPACATESLVDNYRSRPGIVDFFDRWMADHEWSADGATMRFAKRIQATRAASGPDPQVVKVTAGTRDWEDEVVAFLQGLHASGRLADWNQAAFLFRSVRNDKVVALARRLEAEGIPVYSPRSNLYFEREEVMLAVGALRLCFPQFDEVVTASWKGEPPPIFAWYDACATAFLDRMADPEHSDLKKWLGYRRRDHKALAEEADYAFSGLFYELLAFPLFATNLDEREALGGVRDSRPARNLAMLSRLLTRFEAWHGVTVLHPKFLEANLRALFTGYLRFLFDGGIDEFEDEADYAPSGCVAFLTVHQAKGLQFPITIVGLPPTGPRKQYDALDEVLQRDHYHKPPFEPLERTKYYDFWRLYYTAFSRAQDLLVLTTPEKLDGAGRKFPCAEFHQLCADTPSWRTLPSLLPSLDLSPVKKAHLKAEYSFTSHVTVYENCARQYQFFKELEFTPVRSNSVLFGTLVHQTIEDIHKTALRGEADAIDSDRVERWLRDNYRHLSKRERRYLSEQAIRSALQHVLRYVDHVGGDWSQVVAAEVDVSLVRPAYILAGSIDLVQGEGDTVDIVDFKSEAKPDLERDADRLLRYRRQLEVYGHLVQERHGKRVRKLHLHYTGALHGNPRVSFDMDPARVNGTIEDFDRVVARIERKEFGITERPATLCKNCDMRHYCDRRGD